MNVMNNDRIMDLEERRYAAMLANDADMLAPLLDDEVTYIHSSAVSDSKQAYLNSIREGRLVYHAFRREYAAVVPMTAANFLVTGRIGIDITLNAKPYKLDNLFVAVWWARTQDAWRLISWQSTPVPAAAK